MYSSLTAQSDWYWACEILLPLRDKYPLGIIQPDWSFLFKYLPQGSDWYLKTLKSSCNYFRHVHNYYENLTSLLDKHGKTERCYRILLRELVDLEHVLKY